MAMTRKEFLEIYKKVYGSKDEPKKEIKKKKVKTNYASKYFDAGIENLRNAVVEQAAKDYISSLKRGRLTDPNGVREIEEWFRGKYYKFLVHETIDGETVIESLRQQAIEDLQEKIKEIKKLGIRETGKENPDHEKIVKWDEQIKSIEKKIRWIQKLGKVA